MCKIGDIIAVNNFIGDGKNNVGFHYFIVVEDEKGTISGFSFDIVSVVMSSFQSEEHKRKKLKYEANIEIDVTDGNVNGNKLKNGYIKADQLFYFDKHKTKYYVVGQVDGDVLIKLIEHINYLDKKGLLKENLLNLKYPLISHC